MKFLCLVIAVFAVAVSGCKSTENLSETQQQALMAAYNAQAVKLATSKDDDHIAEFLSAMPESGAVGWAKSERPAYGQDGLVLKNPDGTIAFITDEAIGKSNSMRDFPAGVEEALFKLAGIAVNPKTGEILSLGGDRSAGEKVNGLARLEGLSLYMKGNNAGSTMSAKFAQVWADKTVAEKNAAANGVKLALEAKKGMIVEILSATGDVVRGVLKEVSKATPMGAGLAAVEAIVTTADGTEVSGHVVEPAP
jgi:hypothetical protein